jgi:SAM-dependent methyltransferase
VNRTPQEWHARFQQQAGWTESLRRYLFSRLRLGPSARVLEVGCGTGAITATLHAYTQSYIFGLDLNPSFLKVARAEDPASHFSAGNALHLPFPTDRFDAVVCHYFLLWVTNPETAINEMVRVCVPGGAVLALAEPDYGGRVDYPPPLDELGRRQAAALQSQGADPEAGRKLSGWLHGAGLAQIESGVLGGQWQGAPSEAAWGSEWATLEADLREQMTPAALAEMRTLDRQAWASGSRVLFVPTFYGMGWKA